MLGMPGSGKQQIMEQLAKSFDWKPISTGKLIREHVEKKGAYADRIAACMKDFDFVDDEIVIELVQEQVKIYEKKCQSWIIQGFPRTKVQANSLQQMGVIPDKFVNLNITKAKSHEHIMYTTVQGENAHIVGDQADEACNKIYNEQEMHQNAVIDTFNQFVYQCDACDKPEEAVVEDLKRMLRIRFRSNAPRRPPKIIVIGPPGSGKTTQAQKAADTFGLVLVSPTRILREEAERNPPIKIKIQEAMEKGEQIPDEILLRLIDQRINQSDCRVNGWILEGFPQTESQVNLLKSMRIKPSLVCMFEQNCDESVRKLGNRRVDPMTGESFNVEVAPPKTNAQLNRLVSQKDDTEEIVRTRYALWSDNITMLEENYKEVLLSVSTDRNIDAVFETIKDAIENPII